MDCARAWLEAAKPATQTRPLLSLAITEDEPALTTALNDEEQTERLKDKAYWLPLKQKLVKMRMDR